MSVSGGSSGKGEKKPRRARGKKAMKQAIQAADLKSSKKPARKHDKTSTDKGPDPKDLLHSGRAAGDKEAQDAGVQGEQQPDVDKPGQTKKTVEEGGETPLCDGCGEQLASSKVAGDKVRFTFREHGGERYCNTCYATKIAPACSRCHLAIVDTVTNAMGKNWHPACLTCALCNAQLQSTFYLQDHKPGVPYCSFCIKGVQQTANNQRTAGTGGGGYSSLGGMTWPAQPRTGPGGAARLQNFQ